jgi:dipeptidyl aminopeptidase/acylaminoacyl peptidase
MTPLWITRALRESAVAVELVVYPHEPHGLQERTINATFFPESSPGLIGG